MKIALVTGGSRGISWATSLLLARKGYCVVVNYRHNGAAEEKVVAQILQLYQPVWRCHTG